MRINKLSMNKKRKEKTRQLEENKYQEAATEKDGGAAGISKKFCLTPFSTLILFFLVTFVRTKGKERELWR